MVIGIDIGGTTTKFGLFEPDGSLIDKWNIVTITDNAGKDILPNAAASILSKLVEKNVDKSEISAIGIGVPCPITRDGHINTSANLGWKEPKDVTKELESLTKIRSFGGNDANVAALGEAWLGAAKGYDNVVMVTLGTGVGGGIISNGNLLFGAHGMAGEIGHIHVEDNETQVCGCGAKGCLEQMSSATGIVRLAGKHLSGSNEDSLLRNCEVTAKAVFDAYKSGDKLAGKVVDEFARYLAIAFVDISMVVDPEVFVIGGGVSAAGVELVEPVRKYYQELITFGLCDDNKFVLAELGNDAGIYGAAKLAIDSMK